MFDHWSVIIVHIPDTRVYQSTLIKDCWFPAETIVCDSLSLNLSCGKLSASVICCHAYREVIDKFPACCVYFRRFKSILEQFFVPATTTNFHHKKMCSQQLLTAWIISVSRNSLIQKITWRSSSKTRCSNVQTLYYTCRNRYNICVPRAWKLSIVFNKYAYLLSYYECTFVILISSYNLDMFCWKIGN